MKIFPAIDIKDKNAVRLEQGDYNKVSVYSSSPLKVAISFEKIGAKHLHVVDLDGAKSGELSNFEIIASIAQNTDLFIQVGGGIRDEYRIKKYIGAGVSRVILGTVALENPEFVGEMVAKYGDKIAVGIDAKDGKVAIKGWTEISAVDSIEFCKSMEKLGVKTIIYTDISKDGMMSGSNIEIYGTLQSKVSCNIIASGGVSTADEVGVLAGMDMYGAIIGKAIYTGDILLKEVLTYE